MIELLAKEGCKKLGAVATIFTKQRGITRTPEIVVTRCVNIQVDASLYGGNVAVFSYSSLIDYFLGTRHVVTKTKLS